MKSIEKRISLYLKIKKIHCFSVFRSSHEEDDDDDLWDENDEWWNIQYTQNNNSTESIQREMTISNKYAGLVIGKFT